MYLLRICIMDLNSCGCLVAHIIFWCDVETMTLNNMDFRLLTCNICDLCAVCMLFYLIIRSYISSCFAHSKLWGT